MPDDRMRPPEWVEYAITRFIFDGAKLYAVLLGAGIMLGGDKRLTGPSFGTLVTWAPAWMWGAFLALAGLLAVVNARSRLIGFAVISCWFWLWTSALTVNYVLFQPGVDGCCLPTVTGPVTYFVMSVAYTAMTVALWMSRGESHVSS